MTDREQAARDACAYLGDRAPAPLPRGEWGLMIVTLCLIGWVVGCVVWGSW